VHARTGERLEQQIAELAAERDRLASGAEIAPVSAVLQDRRRPPCPSDDDDGRRRV
jgi:hypothetical protein